VRETSDAIEIGAMTTLTEVATKTASSSRDTVCSRRPPARASRDPQPRVRFGGNVSQDARCWYYRAGWPCYRASGNICYPERRWGGTGSTRILGADRV